MAKQQVSVLLVDDAAAPRKVLHRAFEAFDGEFEFNVAEASTVEDYHEAVGRRHFDVVILDLGFDGATSNIIETHLVHSPGTMIIVYSAFTNLDVIPTCVRALRAGAVDCIKKGDPGDIQAILDSVCRELRTRNSPETAPS